MAALVKPARLTPEILKMLENVAPDSNITNPHGDSFWGLRNSILKKSPHHYRITEYEAVVLETILYAMRLNSATLTQQTKKRIQKILADEESKYGERLSRNEPEIKKTLHHNLTGIRKWANKIVAEVCVRDKPQDGIFCMSGRVARMLRETKRGK